MLGYFFLPPPGFNSVSAALEAQGQGQGQGQFLTKVTPKESEPALDACGDIVWALPAAQTGLLLPHLGTGALPTWAPTLGLGLQLSSQLLCPHLHFPLGWDSPSH